MNARNLLAVPYKIARTPLTVLESGVASRLPAESRPRLAVEWTLGMHDQLAGRVFANSSLTREGADRLQRVRKIVQAADLTRKATERREAAEAIAKAGARQATQKAQRAQERVITGLDEAETVERQGKQAAAAEARETAARKKNEIQAETSSRVRTIENSVKQAEAVANAVANKAREDAAAKLSEAAHQRAEAESKRTDANRLDNLAKAKRESRTGG